MVGRNWPALVCLGVLGSCGASPGKERTHYVPDPAMPRVGYASSMIEAVADCDLEWVKYRAKPGKFGLPTARAEAKLLDTLEVLHWAALLEENPEVYGKYTFASRPDDFRPERTAPRLQGKNLVVNHHARAFVSRSDTDGFMRARKPDHIARCHAALDVFRDVLPGALASESLQARHFREPIEKLVLLLARADRPAIVAHFLAGGLVSPDTSVATLQTDAQCSQRLNGRLVYCFELDPMITLAGSSRASRKYVHTLFSYALAELRLSSDVVSAFIRAGARPHFASLQRYVQRGGRDPAVIRAVLTSTVKVSDMTSFLLLDLGRSGAFYGPNGKLISDSSERQRLALECLKALVNGGAPLSWEAPFGLPYDIAERRRSLDEQGMPYLAGLGHVASTPAQRDNRTRNRRLEGAEFDRKAREMQLAKNRAKREKEQTGCNRLWTKLRERDALDAKQEGANALRQRRAPRTLKPRFNGRGEFDGLAVDSQFCGEMGYWEHQWDDYYAERYRDSKQRASRAARRRDQLRRTADRRRLEREQVEPVPAEPTSRSTPAEQSPVRIDSNSDESSKQPGGAGSTAFDHAASSEKPASPEQSGTELERRREREAAIAAKAAADRAAERKSHADAQREKSAQAKADLEKKLAAMAEEERKRKELKNRAKDVCGASSPASQDTIRFSAAAKRWVEYLEQRDRGERAAEPRPTQAQLRIQTEATLRRFRSRYVGRGLAIFERTLRKEWSSLETHGNCTHNFSYCADSYRDSAAAWLRFNDRIGEVTRLLETACAKEMVFRTA